MNIKGFKHVLRSKGILFPETEKEVKLFEANFKDELKNIKLPKSIDSSDKLLKHQDYEK